MTAFVRLFDFVRSIYFVRFRFFDFVSSISFLRFRSLGLDLYPGGNVPSCIFRAVPL